MKKHLKIAFLTLLIGSFSYMGYQIIAKINHKKEVATHIKTIPLFEYQNLDGSVFSNNDLKEKMPTIFIYFNSECEHCQSETEMIKENIEKFNHCQLVFISFEQPNTIKKFATHYQLDHYDNIYFIRDSRVTFSTTFDIKSLPCIVLYDKNRLLIEKIKGQTKAEYIIEKMNPK